MSDNVGLMTILPAASTSSPSIAGIFSFGTMTMLNAGNAREPYAVVMAIVVNPRNLEQTTGASPAAREIDTLHVPEVQPCPCRFDARSLLSTDRTAPESIITGMTSSTGSDEPGS